MTGMAMRACLLPCWSDRRAGAGRRGGAAADRERGAFLDLVEGQGPDAASDAARGDARRRQSPGRAFGFDGHGELAWKDGFFCRTLRWSGGARDRELPDGDG